MRVSAVVGLLLVAGYYALRYAAGQCSGAACDWYIPLSLVIPIAVLLTVAVGGTIAFRAALRDRARRWAVAIAVTTTLGVAGPPLTLLVFPNSPDALVATATVLWLLGLGDVLAYGLRPNTRT